MQSERQSAGRRNRGARQTTPVATGFPTQSSEDRVDGKKGLRRWDSPLCPCPAGGQCHLHRSLLCRQVLKPQEAPCHPREGHPGPVGRAGRRAFQAHPPQAFHGGGGCPGPPPPEKLTWDLLCGLLPCLVGAAPALGQEGRRPTAEDKESHLF